MKLARPASRSKRKAAVKDADDASRHAPSADSPARTAGAKGLPGSQTLIRGLDVMEAAALGMVHLGALSESLELNRSTTHRLAATCCG